VLFAYSSTIGMLHAEMGVVRLALERSQVRHILRNNRNRRDAGGPGVDHGNPLAIEVDEIMRPVSGMVFFGRGCI
jgi:hypothetical protein